MNKSQCFACGVNKKIEDFRYVTKDQGVDRSAYYSCSTQCLLALANAAHEFSSQTTTHSPRAPGSRLSSKSRELVTNNDDAQGVPELWT